MHVGFSLLTLFPGRVGGAESNASGLLNEFAAGNGPDRVSVLANRHVMKSYAGRARGPVTLHHVRSYRPGDSDVTRLAAMLGARIFPGQAARDVPAGLDVVHYPATISIPRTRAPTITTLHDVQHHDLPMFFSRAERAFRRWAYDDSARKATVVITSSEFSRGRIGDLLGVPRGRIEVVPLGIDRERFSPEPTPRDEQLLDELELPPRFAVYPANLWPHKNHARLVDAMASLAGKDVHLLLTGQTYGRLDALMARAHTQGVADKVRHLGYVPADAVPALYRRALAMVFPSLYEGFGTPPLEAMACGCPVAVSTAGSLPELCGDAALTLDPQSPKAIASALERLISDAALRSRLSEAGPERATAYTWRAAAERHTEIYARVAAARMSAGAGNLGLRPLAPARRRGEPLGRG